MKGSEKLLEIIVEEKIIKVNGDIASRFYTRGKELGKGGFARVYELINNETKVVTAAKVIQKSSLIKGRARQKLMSEIKIHRSVHHNGIVNFENFFEDSDNIYILLELCSNGTLNEKLKRRRRLTELEVQCYLMQILAVLKYLYSLRIVHRDIKLSNLFLNENMELKLGDFGLACKIEFEGERKRTMCGTPNYIAPEILDGRTGHSFEVDVWSFGIMAYTLLIGKPPYQAEDARATYRRIKANNYTFPDNVVISNEAKSLISSILVKDPSRRLTLDQIGEHAFFNRNIMPRTLPHSTLAIPPSPGYLKQFEGYGDRSKNEEFAPLSPRTETSTFIRRNLSPRETTREYRNETSNRLYICSSDILLEDEIWVQKWVDYSDKYGLGYKLSNGLVGVYFNDLTKMVFSYNNKIQYYQNKTANEDEYKEFLITEYPAELQKKITILQHFNRHLKIDKNIIEGPLPHIKKWISNSVASIFRLNNKTVHVVFHDKIELLILSQKKKIVFMENSQQFVCSVSDLNESQNPELIKRMRFTKEILTGMVQK
jgi:polo-like kinase 1